MTLLIALILALGGWVWNVQAQMVELKTRHELHAQQRAHPHAQDSLSHLKSKTTELSTEIKGLRREQKQAVENIIEHLKFIREEIRQR